MIFTYRIEAGALTQLEPQAGLEPADWIDLYRPQPAQVHAAEALGLHVPTLEDMEEIEISNRLYRDAGTDVVTVSLPGLGMNQAPSFGPVAFLITPNRLVTVRYHAPRPFTTFPTHAAQSSAGCGSYLHLFLGLVEEIVARLADLLEGVGKALDTTSGRLFDEPAAGPRPLEEMLYEVGRRGEDLARYRLSLLTLERALSAFGVWREERDLRPLLKSLNRDIQALLVHADFLSSRVAHVTDVILGMVNLEQSGTSRTVSTVAVMFLPPTLVASVYGMNFGFLPGLDHPYG
ncbi:CorA family divalent cation transporter, partial [Cribrihabitans sp. XS_ASV171]